MNCVSCRSGNQAEFPAEVMIHFSGIRHIHSPAVLVFPKVLVCLDCGFSSFTTPGTELHELGKGVASSLSASSIPPPQVSTLEHQPQ
jgi:hypothetical protein